MSARESLFTGRVDAFFVAKLLLGLLFLNCLLSFGLSAFAALGMYRGDLGLRAESPLITALVYLALCALLAFLFHLVERRRRMTRRAA